VPGGCHTVGDGLAQRTRRTVGGDPAIFKDDFITTDRDFGNIRQRIARRLAALTTADYAA
jgi:hypothetical protein